MSVHPESREGTVIVNEARVFFHDTGTPDSGAQPIVLVHGTGGSTARHFRTLYAMLAARYRVIGVDLDTNDPTVTMSDLELQVRAVIEERSPDRAVVLVGYSLGAVVAAGVAERFHRLVSRLVLMAGWVRTDSQQKLRNTLWSRLRASDQEALKLFMTFTAFSPSFLSGRSDAELETLIASRKIEGGYDVAMGLNRDIDLSDRIGSISQPTLVIAGSNDQMVPARHAQELFGGIPNSRFAEVPSGHALTTERPAQVFELIDDFLERPEDMHAGAVVTTLPL